MIVDVTGFRPTTVEASHDLGPSDVTMFKNDRMSAIEKVERVNDDEIN
jgi:hypothetical protein